MPSLDDLKKRIKNKSRCDKSVVAPSTLITVDQGVVV